MVSPLSKSMWKEHGTSMFAWKYLLQIHQEDHIPCSVCSLEEAYSLIWFPAFIFLKGTNDNYCLLWSVFFSMNNSPKKHLLCRWGVTADNMLPYFAFILEWQELGLGLTDQHHSAVPRHQDHLLSVSWLLGVFCSIFWCFEMWLALMQYLCASRRACAHAS